MNLEVKNIKIEQMVRAVKPANSVSFTSEIFDVGQSTIHRLINNSGIPVIEIGERKLVPGWFILEKLFVVRIFGTISYLNAASI